MGPNPEGDDAMEGSPVVDQNLSDDKAAPKSHKVRSSKESQVWDFPERLYASEHRNAAPHAQHKFEVSTSAIFDSV